MKENRQKNTKENRRKLHERTDENCEREPSKIMVERKYLYIDISYERKLTNDTKEMQENQR